MIDATSLDQFDTPHRIHFTPLSLNDLESAREQLNASGFTRKVTSRDQELVTLLRQLHALSVDQIQRLFWPIRQACVERSRSTQDRPDAALNTAYRRASVLVGYGLLAQAQKPNPAAMAPWRIQACPECNRRARRVLTLGLGGWVWLNETPTEDQLLRHTDADQVLRNLLVAEVSVRLAESVHRRDLRFAWSGDETTRFSHPKTHAALVASNGLGRLYTSPTQNADWSCLLELDNQSQTKTRTGQAWVQTIRNYEALYPLSKSFPVLKHSLRPPTILLVTQNNDHTVKLAQWLRKHQTQPISFCLTTWSDLITADDLLTDPIWLIGNPAENKPDWTAARRPLTETMPPALRAVITDNPSA